METTVVVRALGAYHLAWAIFDASWPKILNWKKTLAPIDGLNRTLLYVLSRLLVVLYAALAYVFSFHAREIVDTSLGRMILGFVVLYWGARSVMQLQFFGVAGKANRVIDVDRRELNFPLVGSNQLVMNAIFVVILIGVALPSIALVLAGGIPLAQF